MIYRAKSILIIACLFVLAISTAEARWLIINTIPADASVLVNDKDAGTAPVRLEGQDDEQVTITVRLQDYNDYIFQYSFRENRVIFIDLEEGIEMDESTYWQRKTSGTALQLDEILPAETAEETADVDVVEMEPVTAEAPAVDDDTSAAEQPDETVGDAEAAPEKTDAQLKEVPELGAWPEAMEGKTDKGFLVFDIEVRSGGGVGDIDAETEILPESLENYLKDWMDEWTFEPATEDGEPIRSNVKAKVVYNLETGTFELPDYDMVRTAELPEPRVVIETVRNIEETAPASEAGTTANGDIIYYTKSQVDTAARVFSPPSAGNIPLNIINMNLQGDATFKVYIKPSGEVTHVDIVKSTGDDTLDAYVIPMIEKSFWEPAKKDGKSVGFVKNINLNFYTTACKFEFTDL